MLDRKEGQQEYFLFGKREGRKLSKVGGKGRAYPEVHCTDLLEYRARWRQSGRQG